MAIPQVGGTVTQRFAATSAPIDISAIPDGAWMLLSVMTSISGIVLTPAPGWTVLQSGETTGTRRNFLYAKIKEASDGATANFTQSSTTTSGYALLWGTGGVPVGLWTIGSSRVRQTSGEPSGARYTNIAPSVTTVGADSLAIAISQEATNAKSQPLEVASVAPSGWTQRLWHEQFAANDRIETAWMGTKEMPTVGATGDVTLTYVSQQDLNGWAIQVVIPSEIPVLTVPKVVGVPTTFATGAGIKVATIDRPSGITVGDYIVIAMRHQSSVVTEVTVPSGFTRLGPAFVPSSASYRFLGFYGKPITDPANEALTYEFSFTTESPGRAVAVAFIVRGVDTEDPVAGFYNDYAGDAIANGRVAQSYTQSSAPSLAVFMGVAEFTTPYDHIPLSYPAGYTALAQVQSSTNLSTSRSSLWVGTQEVEGFTVPAGEMTWDTPAGEAVESIVLRGSNSPPLPPEGPGLALLNGQQQEVRVFHTTEDGPRTPSRVFPMRRGFNSVAEMLATPGFTWAHRGGSASYPEHSLYAYTQSVARGYGVLEVSLGRTSDGVWFGLHDQTTDHTSGGTYGNASAQTWAQIQAQQIVVGAQGAPQPYMRLVDLIAIYGTTHIFVLDPKYALGSYRTEFLNLVDTLLGPTRAIIKFSGSGSGAAALSTAAQALGYQTWGFFYATDASAAQGGNGGLQTWGPSWTLIGMEYGASQAVWDEALALGKPIIGHIAPNQTAYNTAMAKGATGVQVSGVGAVAPVSWWT